jgi:hypothetical protein
MAKEKATITLDRRKAEEARIQARPVIVLTRNPMGR